MTPPEDDFDKENLDDVESELDKLAPDTDTELEAEFKEELAGGPPTREYTSEEAAEAAGGGQEHEEEEKDAGDEHEWEPEGEEGPDTAEEQQESEEHEPEPAAEETEVRHPDTEEQEEHEEEPEEHPDEEPEPSEEEEEEPAEVTAQAAVPVPLAPTGPTPAGGTLPPGMMPPVGFVPQPDEPGEKPPRPHLFLRFLAAAVLVVGAFAAATSITILNYFSDIASGLGHDARLNGVDRFLASANGGKPQTILIVGSDKRFGESDRGRSDTTILLRLDPNRDAISMLSIPRDLKTEIPGHGINKFNAAYTYGGPKLTLRVVKQLTGLRVNHLVNVDFAGFQRAINEIGCVYVDVDHHYYHSNVGLSAAAQYAEINIQPGYQKLCGSDALAYVRYRHQDNDLVRSARQHDFLREARQKVGPSKLIGDRKQLIKIFTTYTSSDIDDPQTMLAVLKLFLAARGAPIKEVHFPAQIGPSYVTASPPAVHAAARAFLGITGSSSPRGSLSKPLPGATTGKKAKKHKKKKKKPSGHTDLIPSATGKTQGNSVANRVPATFPVFYPTKAQTGSIYAQAPRVYSIVDAPGQPHFSKSYKMILKTPLGEYYGIEGTTWSNPPIIRSPSETRTIRGQEYLLYYDSDRLRLVAWHYKNHTYWLNNTLLETLSEGDMLGIAKSMGVMKGH